MSNNIIGKGTTGEQGPQGFAGVDGTDGTDGTNGIDGVDGSQGLPGVDGSDGAKGDQGDTGLTGLTGAKGDQGDIGLTGAKGDQGDQGLSGVIPSSAETITGTNIDWDVDATYYKAITADASFSFTNVTDGMILSVVIEADSTERTVSFPIDVKWPDDTEIDKVEASTTRIFTFIGANSEVFSTTVGGYV